MPQIILKNAIVKRLGELKYRLPSHIEAPSAAWALKSTILEGKCDIDIKSQNSFEVTMTDSLFAECIYADFYYGYERILKQNHCLHVLLKEANTPAAWCLVTAYYSAFFAAIEIGKILGRISTYIDQSDARRIQYRSGGAFLSDLEFGNYLGGVRLDAHKGYVMVRFSRHGERPHQQAWQNLSVLFPNEVKNLSSARQKQIKLFKEIISNDPNSRWPTPSEIRNQWNYTNANYYGSLGERNASIFCKNAQSNSSCYSWATTKRLQPDEKNTAASVAFVNTVLLDVVENIKPKILGSMMQKLSKSI
jgi:hypothetical protein